jgi:hypothetical protein
MSNEQASEPVVFNLASFADVERVALLFGLVRYTPESIRRFLEECLETSKTRPRPRRWAVCQKATYGLKLLDAADLAGAIRIALELYATTNRAEASRKGGHGKGKVNARYRQDARAQATTLWQQTPLLEQTTVVLRIFQRWQQDKKSDIPSRSTVRHWIADLDPRRHAAP